MKNIVFICQNISSMGGVEVVTVSCAKEMVKKNNVSIVSLNLDKIPDELNKSAIKLFDVKADKNKSVLSKKEILRIVDYCKSIKCDKVIVQMNTPHRICKVANYGLLRRLCELCKTETVLHNSPTSFVRRYRLPNDSNIIFNLKNLKTKIIFAPYAKKIIRKISHVSNICVLSKGCKDELKKVYGVDSVVRYNTYSFIEKGALEKKNIITYVGRFSPEKNIMLILNAWKKCAAQDWILRLVGDGQEIDAIRNFIREHKLVNVELTGGKSHYLIANYLDESKILVMASTNEGWPTVIVEAMNNRNAILTTHFDGFSDEILLENENCLIADFEVNDYAKKMNLLLQDTIYLENMMDKAYERCKSFYTSDDYKSTQDAL
ncbi:MAG: glycosyltransferase family 4 protein [Treponema sp.]|nr:glycosyltransferase family 4 protein [Treponema sp.]